MAKEEIWERGDRSHLWCFCQFTPCLALGELYQLTFSGAVTRSRSPLAWHYFFNPLLSINSPQGDRASLARRCPPGQASPGSLVPQPCSGPAQLQAASALLPPVQPSSQRHFGWKGPLEGHLQSRGIFQVRAAFPLAGTGTCRYGFSGGMVCGMWLSAKRVQDWKEKKPTTKRAENPAPRIRGVKGIRSCLNRVQTIKISHCYWGLISSVGMGDNECPSVGCHCTDAASVAHLLGATDFHQRRVSE